MGYADKPEGCKGCPAAEWGRGFVPPRGSAHPLIALVGQGPGQQEAFTSQPFFHAAPVGERLNKWLHTSLLSRYDHTIVGNLVQCWLPEAYKGAAPVGNREPTQAETNWCWNAHVGPWLHALEPDVVIVPVGVPATRFLLGITDEDKGAEKFLGTMNRATLPPIQENRYDPDAPDEPAKPRRRGKAPKAGAVDGGTPAVDN